MRKAKNYSIIKDKDLTPISMNDDKRISVYVDESVIEQLGFI